MDILGRLVVLALALAPLTAQGAEPPPVKAPPPTAADNYQAAVQSQIATLVKQSLADFFAKASQPQPESVDVKTRASFDLSAGEPQVRQLRIDVTLVTDQPPVLVRDARAAVQRTLHGNGYRFEAATGDDDKRPLAVLNVDVTQVSSRAGENHSRDYAVFGLLVVLALGGFVWMIYLLSMPFRRPGRRPAPADRGRAQPDRAEGPGVFAGRQPEIGGAAVAPERGPAVAAPRLASPPAPVRLRRDAAAGATPQPASPPSARRPESPPMAAPPKAGRAGAPSGPGPNVGLPPVPSLKVGPDVGLPPLPGDAPRGRAAATVAPPKTPAAEALRRERDTPPAKVPSLAPRLRPSALPWSLEDPPADFAEPAAAARAKPPAAAAPPAGPGAKTSGPPPLPPPAGPKDLRTLSRAPEGVVRQTFDQLPFDKALELLATTDEATRRALIDKLQLRAPVRERLERELAELPRNPPLV